jgi:hypothetical protein
MMKRLPEYVNGLPNLSGAEAEIAALLSSTRSRPVFTDEVTSFGELSSACAIALHMPQPLIAAGGDDLRTAEVIGNWGQGTWTDYGAELARRARVAADSV